MAEKACETCRWWQQYIALIGECTKPLDRGGVCRDTHATDTCGEHQTKTPKDTDNG